MTETLQKILASPLSAGLSNQLAYGEFIETFVTNVRNSGFTYTMQGTSWESILQGGGSGDCNTLSRAAKAFCDAFYGENTATVVTKKTPFFVSTGGLVIDGQTGNVDGAQWVFTEHYWVEIANTAYDVLMCGAVVDESNWIDEDPSYGGHPNFAECKKYGDYHVYSRTWDGPLATRYTLDENLAITAAHEKTELQRFQIDSETKRKQAEMIEALLAAADGDEEETERIFKDTVRSGLGTDS